MDPTARVIYLAEIASKYYDQHKTQQEIADEIGVTRSAVSRLLTEAHQKGIIEIIVHYPYRTSTELEKALQNTFGLKAARVLIRENKDDEETLAGVGRLAAQYFISILNEKAVVGVSWGTGLYQMVRAMRPMSYPHVEVVQLVGGMGAQKPSAIGSLLAPLLADLLGCTCHYLPAPTITESAAVRNAFMQERSIRETLDLAFRADIALVGIGSIKPEVNTPYKLGIINDEELQSLLSAGAVGNVCGYFYDIHGNFLDVDVNHRLVGIELKDLVHIPTVIGVSGGVQKAEGILGALRGKYINILITDDRTARRILEIEGNSSAF
ncbi:MAG: sugar-binding transcriptional regulator [Anaerolineae bacterium]|nr:sugar-binding transcriptional regulator [Anaerolineae bacterium]